MLLLKDKIFTICIFLLLSPLITMGQMPFFNVSDQYVNNLILINPAYCGADDALSVSISSKKQWLGFEGAPTSNSIEIHSPFKSRNIGAGIQIHKSSYGIHHNTSLIGDYAFQIYMPDATLSFGLSFIFTQYETRWDEATAIEEDDNALIFNNIKIYDPNFRVGAYYENKKIFTGLSVHNLIPSNSQNLYTDDNNKIKSLPYQFFYHLGYHYYLNNNFELLPSTIVSYNPNSKLHAELTGQLIYDDKMGIGLSYRSEGNIIALFNYHVNNQFSISYSYGISTKKYSSELGGSHELLLRYVFSYELKVENPR